MGESFGGVVRRGTVIDGVDWTFLYKKILKIRNDGYVDAEGKIPALKKQLADLGFDMSVSEPLRVDLDKLLKDATAYKEHLGAKFDGWVSNRKDEVPGITSVFGFYNRMLSVRCGEYDEMPGIDAVKAKLTTMQYSLSQKKHSEAELLEMLSRYVKIWGRNGNVSFSQHAPDVDGPQLFSFVRRARNGRNPELKERVDCIIGPHPSDREAFEKEGKVLTKEVGRIRSEICPTASTTCNTDAASTDLFPLLCDTFATIACPKMMGCKLSSKKCPVLYQDDALPEHCFNAILDLFHSWDTKKLHNQRLHPEMKAAYDATANFVTYLAAEVMATDHRRDCAELDAEIAATYKVFSEFIETKRNQYGVDRSDMIVRFSAYSDDKPYSPINDRLYDTETKTNISTAQLFLPPGANSNIIVSKTRQIAPGVVQIAFLPTHNLEDGRPMAEANIPASRQQGLVKQRGETRRVWSNCATVEICEHSFTTHHINDLQYAEDQLQRLSKEEGGCFDGLQYYVQNRDRPSDVAPAPAVAAKQQRKEERKKAKVERMGLENRIADLMKQLEDAKNKAGSLEEQVEGFGEKIEEMKIEMTEKEEALIAESTEVLDLLTHESAVSRMESQNSDVSSALAIFEGKGGNIEPTGPVSAGAKRFFSMFNQSMQHVASADTEVFELRAKNATLRRNLAQAQDDAENRLRSEFEKKYLKEMEKKIRKEVDAKHREALAGERRKRKDVERKCAQFKDGFETQTKKLKRLRDASNTSNGSMVSPTKAEKKPRNL